MGGYSIAIHFAGRPMSHTNLSHLLTISPAQSKGLVGFVSWLCFEGEKQYP